MGQQRIDLKKLRAGIFLHYGIELDETSLAILAILSLDLNRQYGKIDEVLNQMASEMQHSKKALQVDRAHSKWQAFWHGMGQWGFGLCLAVVVGLAIFSIDLKREREEKRELRQQLEWYKQQYKEAIEKQQNSKTNKR